MPMLFEVLIYGADILAHASIQDDYQVHHRGISDLQPFPPPSKDRSSVSLLPSTECTADHED